MLVTRGLGRNSTQPALMVTAGLGVAGQPAMELGGRVIRRWKSRLIRRDLDDLPITDKKEFLRRVQRALEALRNDDRPQVRKQAAKAREGLLRADSVKRRSLLRVDFEVVLHQLEVVSWAILGHEEQRQRRRREDEEILVLLGAARQRGWI